MITAKVNGGSEKKVESTGSEIRLNDVPVKTTVQKLSSHQFHVNYGGKTYNVYLDEVKVEDKQVLLKINGKTAEVSLTTEMDLLLKKLGLEGVGGKKVSDVKAPMPGLIHSVAVSEGQTVQKGDVLLILEAMKMENVIKAPADGTVKKVAVKPGQSVDKNHLLIGF